MQLSFSLEKVPALSIPCTSLTFNGQCLDIWGKFNFVLRLGVRQRHLELLRGASHTLTVYQIGIFFLDPKKKVLQLWDIKIPLLLGRYEVAACRNVSVLLPTKILAMIETLITVCIASNACFPCAN